MKRKYQMQKFNYDEEFFNILTKLGAIADSVKIKIENDEVVVKNANHDRSIQYKLSANKEKFNLPIKEINFVSFNKVDKLYRLTKTDSLPEISVDEYNIAISNGDRKVTERLAVAGSISDLKLANFDDFKEIGEFDLSKDDLKYLKRCISTINANYITFKLSNDDLNIKVYDSINATQGVYNYKLNKTVEEEREYTTTTSSFTNLPDYDYKMVFPDATGIFIRKDKSDGYSLDIALSLADE